MAPTLQLVVPSSELHGGIRVPLEISDWMRERGWETRVVGPGSPPDWHELASPWVSVDLAGGENIPSADLTVATFFTTVEPALNSGSRHVFHFCQGYEGQFQEYSGLREIIENAYRAPIPKLVVSEHLKGFLKGRFPANRYYLIGEAVDPLLFPPGKFKKQAPVLRIGVVGSFSYRIKGLRVAFEGLRIARDRGLKLKIHRASAEPETEDEKAFGFSTVFHHRLPTKMMPNFYGGVDAVLFSSISEEGFGLPVIEAMSCGVPVLHSDIPSLRSIPRDATLRFDPGNAPEIAEGLALLRDHRERERLRERGLAAVRRFRPDILIERFERALEHEGISPVRSA